MPVQVACPSCGASVHFQSAGSAVAVCGYCHSALARDGETLKNLGRMAELLADDSPLQIGSSGQWQGRNFAVVGRLQLRYDAGFWNEWHILFDSGRFGWISEAGGQWTLTYLAPPLPDCPSFDALTPGTSLQIGNTVFQVTNREEAVCVAGEGELPCVVGPGYLAPAVDLRAGDYFASLDFSAIPPQCYVGEAVARESLHLVNLRDRASEALAAAPQKTAQALACPACGSPWALHDKAILAMACPACGALSDIEGDIARVRVAAQDALQLAPSLPLGSKGLLAGKSWEVIGYMRKGVGDDDDSRWDEYLLYDGNGGFSWLVCERGHWNYVEQLNQQPHPASRAGRPGYALGKTQFELFARYPSVVLSVLGEFTWKVAVGDRVDVIDYIAPPQILSCEQTENEITWSLGEYLEPRRISDAFGLPPRSRPAGVNACQPNPYARKQWPVVLVFLVCVVLAGLIHNAFWKNELEALFVGQIDLQPGKESTQSSPPFRIAHAQPRLRLRHEISVSNGWADVDVELVNQETGESFAATNEVSYYTGNEDGEDWTEEQRDADPVFKQVPAGTYALVMHGELAAEAESATTDRVMLVPGSAPVSNLVLCVLGLLGFPVWVWMRKGSFERQRWAGGNVR